MKEKLTRIATATVLAAGLGAAGFALTAGTAAAKAKALEDKGVPVGRTPTEVAEIAVEVLGGASVAAS